MVLATPPIQESFENIKTFMERNLKIKYYNRDK